MSWEPLIDLHAIIRFQSREMLITACYSPIILFSAATDGTENASEETDTRYDTGIGSSG